MSRKVTNCHLATHRRLESGSGLNETGGAVVRGTEAERPTLARFLAELRKSSCRGKTRRLSRGGGDASLPSWRLRTRSGRSTYRAHGACHAVTASCGSSELPLRYSSKRILLLG